MTIHNLIFFNTLTTLYKIYNNLAPSVLCSFFSPINASVLNNMRVTRRVIELFTPPKNRLNLFTHTIFDNGVKLFNETTTAYNRKHSLFQPHSTTNKEPKLQNKFLRTFKTSLKAYIMTFQKQGHDTDWDTENFLLHTDQL